MSARPGAGRSPAIRVTGFTQTAKNNCAGSAWKKQDGLK